MKKTDNKPTYCYCTECGEPVTWFNYVNVWEEGKLAGRKHFNCNAPEIIAYKEACKN